MSEELKEAYKLVIEDLDDRMKIPSRNLADACNYLQEILEGEA